jgi:hypothetical protein
MPRYPKAHPKENIMADLSKIQEHAEVIGADGVHVGTVDKVEGNRIKLTKQDSGQGSHEGHHHFIDGGWSQRLRTESSAFRPMAM